MARVKLRSVMGYPRLKSSYQEKGLFHWKGNLLQEGAINVNVTKARNPGTLVQTNLSQVKTWNFT